MPWQFESLQAETSCTHSAATDTVAMVVNFGMMFTAVMFFLLMILKSVYLGLEFSDNLFRLSSISSLSLQTYSLISGDKAFVDM